MIESLQQQRAQDVKDSVVMKQRINKLETTLRDLNKKSSKGFVDMSSHHHNKMTWNMKKTVVVTIERWVVTMMER